jgi:hypothetical protein
MKIKIYFGAFPVPSSENSQKWKLKFYFYFYPVLHHKYFRCQVYFFKHVKLPQNHQKALMN